MNKLQQLIDSVPHEVLINFQIITRQKNEFVKKQQFENAAKKRDEQIDLMFAYPLIRDFQNEMNNIESIIREFKLSEIFKP